jgi:hypothetical protein
LAKLPEEFAPTGPKLSKFPIRPAPPIRPRLFADEARFTFRLALLTGSCEFAAWAWLAGLGRRREVMALAAIRLLGPFWSKVGTRVPRTALAGVLIVVAVCAMIGAVPLLAVGALGAGLPALRDLCASCVGDSVTVERRAAAFAWLDIGQGLGAVAAIALNAWLGGWTMLIAIPMLLVGGLGAFELRDRGTPRSSWPAAAYASVLASPLGKRLTLAAFACGLFAGPGSMSWDLRLSRVHSIPAWVASLLPLAGMAIASRIEPKMKNAMWLPYGALGVEALAGFIGWPPLLSLAIGVMFAAIPGAVARGAGEMERPIASSLAWSALFLGSAVGAVL